MLYWQLEKNAQELLREARVDNPALSARVLLKSAAGLSDKDYLLSRGLPASLATRRIMGQFLERRSRGEPVAYITGKKEFYGRDFKVSSATLIPRPESEQLIDLALANLGEQPCLFLDAGCGSGCLGLTLLCERPAWRGILFDYSQKALEIARENSRLLNIECDFLVGDIFHWFFQPRIFNLIIANLPYISHTEKGEVMAEVLAYEPESALFSPDSGLGHIKALVDKAALSLLSSGILLLEHGWKQESEIEEYLREKGFTEVTAFRDFADLPRVILAKK